MNLVKVFSYNVLLTYHFCVCAKLRTCCLSCTGMNADCKAPFSYQSTFHCINNLAESERTMWKWIVKNPLKKNTYTCEGVLLGSALLDFYLLFLMENGIGEDKVKNLINFMGIQKVHLHSAVNSSEEINGVVRTIVYVWQNQICIVF